jgi:hypothetical protein
MEQYRQNAGGLLPTYILYMPTCGTESKIKKIVTLQTAVCTLIDVDVGLIIRLLIAGIVLSEYHCPQGNRKRSAR